MTKISFIDNSLLSTGKPLFERISKNMNESEYIFTQTDPEINRAHSADSLLMIDNETNILIIYIDNHVLTEIYQVLVELEEMDATDQDQYNINWIRFLEDVRETLPGVRFIITYSQSLEDEVRRTIAAMDTHGMWTDIYSLLNPLLMSENRTETLIYDVSHGNYDSQEDELGEMHSEDEVAEAVTKLHEVIQDMSAPELKQITQAITTLKELLRTADSTHLSSRLAEFHQLFSSGREGGKEGK